MRTRLGAAIVSVLVLGLSVLPATKASADPLAQYTDFIVSCPFSHRLADDPVAHPNAPGASYSNDFFGNRTVNANSTYDSLLAGGTTCDRTADTAAYWMPTVYQGGAALRATRATVYYRNVPADKGAVQPFPPGLRMIAGDDEATAPQRIGYVGWSCRKDAGADKGLKGRWLADAPQCMQNQTLVFRVAFPECWNGRDLDSPDHRSHMAYLGHDQCPKGYPVQLPRISMTIALPSAGGSTISLSTGSVLAGYAGFINSWDQQALATLVHDCLAAAVHCGFQG